MTTEATPIRLESLDKVVELGVYTRKIDKEYNSFVFKNAEQYVDENGKTRFKFNPAHMDDANDYLVGALFGLTDEEVMTLKKSEYATLLKQALDRSNFQ